MLARSVFRTIKKSLGRYMAILSIIALGVGFFAGLRVTEKAMLKTADDYIYELSLYDFRLISTLGLTEDDVAEFKNLKGISKAVGSVSADFIAERENGTESVLHAHTLHGDINGVDLLYGRMPESADECLADLHFAGKDILGETVCLSSNNTPDTLEYFAYDEYTVVGIVNSSEYINFQRGSTSLGNGNVAGFVYLMPEGFDSEYFTEIFLTLSNRYEIHSKEYEAEVDSVRDSVEALLEERASIRFDGIYNDARSELDEAKSELSEKRSELDQAQKELDEALDKYLSERADTESRLAETKSQLDEAESQLVKKRAELEAAKLDPSAAIPEVSAQLAAAEAKLSYAEAEYRENLSAYENALQEASKAFEEAEAELDEAQKEIDDAMPEIEKAEQDIADGEAELSALEKPSVYTLDRNSNFGYVSFGNDIGIVSGIAKVFPLFFFLVAALVCITTMTRMISEQRTQNGILKALGYGNFAVVSQYLIYAGSASVVGCIVGFLLGSKLMPMALWEVYHIMYSISRPIEFVPDWGMFAVITLSYLLCISAITYLVCKKDLNECAAGLMRPVAPSAGKRIFLEYIGFIWKPMKFLHKVSARNILRYKKRMVMMIVGIGGCTALLLTGFGIRDTIQPIVSYQFDEISLYGASVTLRDGISSEEKNAFLDKALEFSSDAELICSGKAYLVSESGTSSVNLISYSDDLSTFIDLHSGTSLVEWPKEGEAVINYRIAELYGISAGDSITLRDNDYRSMTVKVSGVFDNYLYDYVYINSETYASGFGIYPEPNAAYVNFAEDSDSHELGAALLGMDEVAAVSVSDDIKEGVESMLKSLDLIVLIVLVCAGALAFIVLYNLTNITITERTREIATLKVLGFRKNEQRSYVFRENIILTMIGALCGIPLGLALLKYTMSQISIDGFYFGCRLAPESYAWAILITMVFAFIVDLALAGKLRKINMAEAMKAIE